MYLVTIFMYQMCFQKQTSSLVLPLDIWQILVTTSFVSSYLSYSIYSQRIRKMTDEAVMEKVS